MPIRAWEPGSIGINQPNLRYPRSLSSKICVIRVPSLNVTP